MTSQIHNGHVHDYESLIPLVLSSRSSLSRSALIFTEMVPTDPVKNTKPAFANGGFVTWRQRVYVTSTFPPDWAALDLTAASKAASFSVPGYFDSNSSSTERITT